MVIRAIQHELMTQPDKLAELFISERKVVCFKTTSFGAILFECQFSLLGTIFPDAECDVSFTEETLWRVENMVNVRCCVCKTFFKKVTQLLVALF